jgi:hypothetical protein
MIMSAKRCQMACGLAEECQLFSYDKITKICYLFSTQNRATCDTVIATKSLSLTKCRSRNLQTRKFTKNQSKFGKQRFLKGLN